jgi:hypothetical protein
MDQARDVIRRKYFSIRTEEAWANWIRSRLQWTCDKHVTSEHMSLKETDEATRSDALVSVRLT